MNIELKELYEFIELNKERCESLCESLHMEVEEDNLLQMAEYLLNMI